VTIRLHSPFAGTFYDAAGSSLIAYATYRLASLSPTNHSQHIDAADNIYNAVQDKLTPYGIFTSDTNVVDALTFTTPAQVSAESLAFLVLLSSAKRDYQEGNVTGITGVTTGFKGGAASTLHLTYRTTSLMLGLTALTTTITLTLI
jgi:hypothetical protein